MKKTVKSWLKIVITTILVTFFILILSDYMNKIKETFDEDDEDDVNDDDDDNDDDESGDLRSIDKTIRMKKENITSINKKALDDDRGLTGDEIKKMKSNLTTIRQLQSIRDVTSSSGVVSSTMASTRNRLTSLLSR